MFTAALFTIVLPRQDMEAAQISIKRRTDKENEIHIYNGILLSHQKAWNNAIYNNMDGPRGYKTK